MKKILVIIILGFSLTGLAQYKNSGTETPSIMDGIVDHSVSTGNLFGFLNANNFQMRQSVDMSYQTSGGQGLALGVYTNSMFFKLGSDLNFQTDISLVNSPYSTLGKDFQNSLNGIYLSRAALNYQPFKDMSISIEYNRLPGGYNPYNGFGSYNRFSPWGF